MEKKKEIEGCDWCEGHGGYLARVASCNSGPCLRPENMDNIIALLKRSDLVPRNSGIDLWDVSSSKRCCDAGSIPGADTSAVILLH